MPLVLRIAAGVLFAAGCFEYFALGEFIAAPFVGAVVVLVLSVAVGSWPRPVAMLVLAISVFAPIAALMGTLRGDLHWAVPIFDLLLFGWVGWNAWASLRSAPLSA